MTLSKLQEAVERKKKEMEAQAQPQVEGPSVDADLVPSDETGRSEEDLRMDAIMDKISLLTAYKKWGPNFDPKMAPGQRESIKIRCPIPGHEDSHPSAWMNLDKDLWHCGSCEQGGDKYTIAAFKLGYPVPTTGANYHRLRESMAVDMGIVLGFQKVPGSKETFPVYAEEEKNKEEVIKESKSEQTITEKKEENTGTLAAVTEIYPGASDEEDQAQNDQILELLPPVPWEKFAASGTWLREWMDITTQDDVPNEFHFGHGLLGLSLVAGGNVRLCEKDYIDEFLIPGNLFVCLLGSPGTGKSKSKRYLDNLVNDNLPFNRDSTTGFVSGVKLLGEPASGEQLVKMFSEPWCDPTVGSGKIVSEYMPVNGLLEFDELESMVKRIKREGSTLRTFLLQLYDCKARMYTEAITTGAKEARNPYGSVICTTQPKSLPRLMGTDDASSGFLSRWLFLPGKPKKQIHFGGVNLDVSPSYTEYQKIRGWAGSFSKTHPVGMDTGARKLGAEFFEEVLLKDKNKEERDMLRRIDFLFKKLLLLVAVNERQKVISVEQVERVIAIYPYLLATYGISGDRIGETKHDEIKQGVLSVLKKQRGAGKEMVALRDIKRSLAKRKYQDADLQKTIKLLVELQYIEEITTPKGQLGRPTTRYRAVGED